MRDPAAARAALRTGRSEFIGACAPRPGKLRLAGERRVAAGALRAPFS